MQELERQVGLLRERDGQLQYTVKEQEAKIEALKLKLKNTGDKVKLNFNLQLFLIIAVQSFQYSGQIYSTKWSLPLSIVHVFLFACTIFLYHDKGDIQLTILPRLGYEEVNSQWLRSIELVLTS